MGNQINKTDLNVYTINANGDNTYSNVSNILKPLHYKKIWVGNCQTFALDYKNNLYSFGLNDYFQLGNLTKTNYLFNSNNNKNNNNVKTKKTIFNTFKCLNKIFPIPTTKISKISTGDGFSLFLTKEGKVYSLGKNNKYQLGYEISNKESEIINGIKCLKKPNEIEYFSKNNIFIVNIFSGSDFSFAKDEKGIFYSWGNNEHNQLAKKNNTKKYEIYPSKADLIPENQTIQNLVCGWMHCAFLNYKGEVFLWGNLLYDYDKNIKDIIEPYKLNLKGKAIEISSGFFHIGIICNVIDKYELYTFGGNDFGQLGYDIKNKNINYDIINNVNNISNNNYNDNKNNVSNDNFNHNIINHYFNKYNFNENKIYSEIPLKVEFNNKKCSVLHVSCGAFHTICLLDDSSVYGFGNNEYREVGLYQSDIINYPSIVNWIDKDDNKVIQNILCGNGFTYILKVNKENFDLKKKEENANILFSEMFSEKDSIKK